MKTRGPYETLAGKAHDTVVRELEQLIGAAKITMAEGGHWLLGQRAPKGPIMRERDISFVYKCVWGAYAACMDRHYIVEMLNWLYENALRPNGDFFFPEEVPGHRIDLRIYRVMVFLKFAALLEHRMIHDEKVLRRLGQYQDTATGGCFHYIGEDPARPTLPSFIRVGETAFFGECALACGLKDEALRAGAWMLKLAQDNHAHMTREGIFYCQTDRRGELITVVGPGEKIFKTVNNWDANQAGWMLGCAMAFLADLYDTMRDKWGYEAGQSQTYLEGALSIVDFEDTMPAYTYLYPSKCKVLWGTGTILRVLLKYGQGTEEQFDKLYRVSKRTFLYTFLGSQLPDGSWAAAHYPLRDDSPELQFDYRVLKGLTLNPREEIKGSTTSTYLPAVEVTGEFLGEIGAMVEGLAPLLELYRTRKP